MRSTAILAVVRHPAIDQNVQPRETALPDNQSARLQSTRLYVSIAGSGSGFSLLTCCAAVSSLRPAKSRSIT